MSSPPPGQPVLAAEEKRAHRITVYSRPGCHLCADALAELVPIAAQAGASLTEVNIEEDDALLLAHLERIPVVLVDGAEVCTFFVDKTAVRAALS